MLDRSRWTRTLICLAMAAASVAASVAESPRLEAAVSAVLHDGRMTFRADHPAAVALRVEVFDLASSELLFDSGPVAGTRLSWPVSSAKGTLRFRVRAWDEEGRLIVASQAVAEGPSTVYSVDFDRIPAGTRLRSGPPVVVEAPLQVGEASSPEALVVPGPSGALTVEGQGSGGSPTLLLEGSGSTTFIDTSENLSDAVILPPGSVESFELIDEPGVAAIWASESFFPPNNDPHVLLERTVAAPTSGYYLAFAVGQVVLLHTGGIENSGVFAVSDDCGDPPSFPYGQSFWLNAHPNLPSADLRQPVSVHGIFPVTGGIHTFCFVGRRLGNGTIEIQDRRLTLVFIPTAYGAVAAQPEPRSASGLTQSERESERQAAAALELDRIAREQAQLQERLEAIRRDLRSEAEAEPAGQQEPRQE